MSSGERVDLFMERLLTEFPEWSNAQTYHVAERIVTVGEQQAFQLEAEAGLAEIPLTTEVRA